MADEPTVTELQAQMEEMQKQLAAANDETTRLRTHSDKLLDEKKKLQAQYKSYEGLSELGDPEYIQNVLKQFQNDEDAKLFAEGKGPDVLKKHTERLTLDFKSQIDDLNKSVESLTSEKTKYEKLYHESEAGHAISAAAIKAGIRDTALDDALMRARGVFTVGDDGQLEARDADGNLITVNNKPLTPETFVLQLREKYPHYWPDSKSGGANGGAGGDSKPNPFVKGPNFNRTEQALMRRNNPELAQRMEAEANAG